MYPIAFQRAKEKNEAPVVQSIISYTKPAAIVEVVKPQIPASAPVSKPAAKANLVFTRDLKVGDRGADVKRLQQYLNQRGFLVATSGNGSLGHETELFGPGTAAALKKFQEKYAEILLKPYGLTEGTGFFGEATRNFISS
jgi:peptidoglycan hydrolase-like protein with peptidoglycan-binding domain